MFRIVKTWLSCETIVRVENRTIVASRMRQLEQKLKSKIMRNSASETWQNKGDFKKVHWRKMSRLECGTIYELLCLRCIKARRKSESASIETYHVPRKLPCPVHGTAIKFRPIQHCTNLSRLGHGTSLKVCEKIF